MRRSLAVAVCGILLAASGGAQAGLYKAGNISEVLDIPTGPPGLGPRIFSVDNRGFTPNTFTIPELTDNEELENPSGFNGYLSIDIEPGYAAAIPNTITLRHEETNTGYQTARLTITDIGFENQDEFITGVALNSGAIIDTLNSDPFTATVSFTDDSITFLFAVKDLSLGQIFHFIPDGSIQFAVAIGTRTLDVPEPAALPLACTALAGLLFARRR